MLPQEQSTWVSRTLLSSPLTLPLQTPAVLQRSGIGDTTLLTPLGITSLIDLKTVGKNLQEQTQNLIGGATNGFPLDGIGPGDAIAFPNIRELFGAGANASIAKIQGSLKDWAQSQAENGLSAEALETIFAIQARVIVEENGMRCECLKLVTS